MNINRKWRKVILKGYITCDTLKYTTNLLKYTINLLYSDFNLLFNLLYKDMHEIIIQINVIFYVHYTTI